MILTYEVAKTDFAAICPIIAERAGKDKNRKNPSASHLIGDFC
jgi:hypothetical protein